MLEGWVRRKEFVQKRKKTAAGPKRPQARQPVKTIGKHQFSAMFEALFSQMVAVAQWQSSRL